MTRLKLTVNETKTRICKLPEEKIRLSGVHVWSVLFAETGRAYLGTVPSKKRVIRICGRLAK